MKKKVAAAHPQGGRGASGTLPSTLTSSLLLSSLELSDTPIYEH